MSETYAWCTEHGFGPCPLLDEARKAYAAKMRKTPPPRGLILVSLCPAEPEYGAVYTRHATPAAARDCLRRALRSERARRTRGAGYAVRVTSERAKGGT